MAGDPYRWIVSVKRTDLLGRPDRPYSREVETEGPNPDVAVKKALDRIHETAPENDLWMSNSIEITVERVA